MRVRMKGENEEEENEKGGNEGGSQIKSKSLI